MAAKKGCQKPEGSGRVKGQANKMSADIKNMIIGALNDAGGQAYLTIQARENPSAFMQLVGKILPKDINALHSGGISINVITGIDDNGSNN